MRYLLFGAGEKGARALEVIGSDRVVAFVDSNINRLGSKYCGKKIIDFEQALAEYKNCIYVITPEQGKKEIAEKLEKKGIYTFFYFDECPMGITYSLEARKVFELYPIKLGFKCCALYGITLFSLLLYEYLQRECNMEVVLIPQKGFAKHFLTLLMEEYVVKDFETAINQVECLVVLKEKERLSNMNINNVQIYDIDEIMERDIDFCCEEIAELKGIHKGKRCFIVATGPSLSVEDLDRLYINKEICISMNRIFNIFDETNWRPDYYLIEDGKMIQDLSEAIVNLDLKNKFVASMPESFWTIPGAESATKFNMIVQSDNAEIKFSPDVSRYVYNGRTVTYVCLQFAVYLGFKEIYLLGVDCNYSNNLYGEENHFKGYEKDGYKVRLNPARMDISLVAYMKAKEYAELNNVKIFNATRGGKLEVFERVDFDDLF